MRLLGLCIGLLLLPHWAAAIGSLDTTDIIWQKQGKDSTSSYGINIGLLGDINGDGYDDIAIVTNDTGGCQIYFGGNPPDTIADGFLLGFKEIGVAGDLTGDGIDDIITCASYVTSGYWQGWMYFYQGYGDSLGSVPYDSVVPPVLNHGFGTLWKHAYVDGDSLSDLLILFQDPFTAPRICLYSGGPVKDTFPEWSFALPTRSHLVSGMALTDFTGDGQIDICLGFQPYFYNAGCVAIFAGPDFGPIPDIIFGHPVDIFPDVLDSTRFAYGLWDVGDIDGDGYSDIGVNHGGRLLIYQGGPFADTAYDYHLQYGLLPVAVAGDLNSDGYPDLIGFGETSSFRSCDVYLGGLAFDTIMDDQMLRSDLPPWVLDRIGFKVSPAGDFNGDGIDDLMFSCQNLAFGYRGAVFVVGGTRDIVTDVEDDQLGVLPDGFELHQNYPNPFNPSTTISFSLPRAHTITLRILNPLGQTVAVLIDHERFGPGEHEVLWNAETDRGQFASGVYFYELSLPSGRSARKMLLLK